jgi:putative protein-disulfide isomerase
MPIRGILAAEALRPGSGPAMLKALQRAHYRDGLRIVELPTIAGVAATAGLDTAQFTAAFEALTDDDLQAHLAGTHRLMREVGARGYPAFVAQTGAHVELLPHESFYGDPEGFADLVSGILPRDAAGAERRPASGTAAS